MKSSSKCNQHHLALTKLIQTKQSVWATISDKNEVQVYRGWTTVYMYKYKLIQWQGFRTKGQGGIVFLTSGERRYIVLNFLWDFKVFETFYFVEPIIYIEFCFI